ncbi:hypothetical protein Acr_18g0008140 [Actinidia rufa]|uniref:Uncharacterized protein n=1 Tax=Actinidia rufa TaxID=165716 RepID=A0A7J0G770_9ERIC|nr:hypothetical protein Acr_18g0008140 [Actinidia rufa]
MSSQYPKSPIPISLQQPSLDRGELETPSPLVFYGCGVLSCHTPAGNVYFLAQFGAVCQNDCSHYSLHLRSCLLPRHSTSSPLDNRAHPMANTGQAPNLEGIHREMHGIIEQIRIMNELNVRMVHHLTTNNLPPVTSLIPEDAGRSCHSHRSATRICRIIRVLVKDAPQGAINADSQVYTQDEEGVWRSLNPDHPSELKIQQVRKLANKEDHLAKKTVCTDIAINPLIRNSKTWMPESMLLISA